MKLPPRTVSIIWLAVGTALLYFSLGSLSQAQGWGLKLPGAGFEHPDRFAGALLSAFGISAGLIVLLIVGHAHVGAAPFPRGPRRRRLPRPFMLPAAAQDDLRLHAAQLAAFVLLPLVAGAVLTVKYLNGTFCRAAETGVTAKDCGTDIAKTAGNWIAVATPDRFDPWMHFGGFGKGPWVYQGGIDYGPWVPWILVALGGAALALLVTFAWRIAR